MKRTVAGLMVAAVVCGSAFAQDDGWTFEVTPYAWFVGVDADVTVGERTVDVDVGFDDLIDQVDLAGELFFTAQKGSLVLWGQIDYLSLSGDATFPTLGPDGVTPVSVKAELENETAFLAGGVGYQIPKGLLPNVHTDVLLGVRYGSLDNELKIPGVGGAKRNNDIVDAILILRPRIPISDKLDFNGTMSIGAGDSDLVWELQPHLQYAFSERWTGRFGYRRLVYDVENDRGNKFDGSFHGFILGFGATF